MNSAGSISAVRSHIRVRIPLAAPQALNPRPLCRAVPRDPVSCIDDRGLGGDYVYLLGLYLGDGCLTPLKRGVWKLRISMDARYPGIIGRCIAAISEVSAHSPGVVAATGWVEVYSCWKHWLCVFPQHGPGRKHHRRIELEAWQRSLVEQHAAELIRGLIHSDGCRVINRVKHYEYPRYFFSNRSPELRDLFVSACASIGVEARPNNRCCISVARRDSVEILDGFIGAKR